MDATAAKRAIDEAGWDPQLARELHELTRSGDFWHANFSAELKALERRYQDVVYSELIYLLTHLRIQPEDARNHWISINTHRASMEDRLGSSVDVRVAMASYFMHVEQLLTNPKIIEMQVYERTRSSAYVDELTGLRNYRCFSEFLVQEIDRSEQYNMPLSLLMLDVDNFKQFNDEFGHEAGNMALREIGKLLGEQTRGADVPVRYGGEEFAVILPSTPKAATIGVAERIREAVEAHAFSADRKISRLTVSLGIATCPADAITTDELVRNADDALYRAKAEGKNRVRYYADSLRSYRRINRTLEGTLSTDGLERHRLTTANLSLGGMLFLTEAELHTGGLVDLQIVLPDGRRTVSASGRVVNVTPNRQGGFAVSTRTIEMSGTDRWALVESLRYGDETASDLRARSRPCAATSRSLRE